MNNQSIREARRANQKKQNLRRILAFGSLAIIFIIGVALWWPQTDQGPMGQEFEVVTADHVAEGQDPGPYNSNPPTSGQHYAAEYDAGFFHPGDPETLVSYPAGYLVHNLEHGYVIFWYNCEVLASGAECTSLQDSIAAVMEDADNWKVIAFPWGSIDVPVVMTTWGRMLEMDEFDPALAMEFVQRNRNEAPEPNAP
jgi:hypothetical protein